MLYDDQSFSVYEKMGREETRSKMIHLTSVSKKNSTTRLGLVRSPSTHDLCINPHVTVVNEFIIARTYKFHSLMSTLNAEMRFPFNFSYGHPISLVSILYRVYSIDIPHAYQKPSK